MFGGWGPVTPVHSQGSGDFEGGKHRGKELNKFGFDLTHGRKLFKTCRSAETNCKNVHLSNCLQYTYVN